MEPVVSDVPVVVFSVLPAGPVVVFPVVDPVAAVEDEVAVVPAVDAVDADSIGLPVPVGSACSPSQSGWPERQPVTNASGNQRLAPLRYRKGRRPSPVPGEGGRALACRPWSRLRVDHPTSSALALGQRFSASAGLVRLVHVDGTERVRSKRRFT
jgi:hypothetical protein